MKILIFIAGLLALSVLNYFVGYYLAINFGATGGILSFFWSLVSGFIYGIFMAIRLWFKDW